MRKLVLTAALLLAFPFVLTLVNAQEHERASEAVPSEAPPLELKDPESMADAGAIHESIKALGLKVSECVEQEQSEPDKCMCRYPDEIALAKKAYENAVNKHPDWADKTVHFAGEEDMVVNISMPTLGMELDGMICE